MKLPKRSKDNMNWNHVYEFESSVLLDEDYKKVLPKWVYDIQKEHTGTQEEYLDKLTEVYKNVNRVL